MTDLHTEPTTPTPGETRPPRRRAVVASVAVLAAIGIVTAVLLMRDTTMNTPRSIAVPTKSDLNTFADTRVFFGHQSVGDNILGGVAALYQQAGLDNPRTAQLEGPTADADPVLGHAFVGANGDPASKIKAFTELMHSGIGDQVDIALMKFCYVDVDSTTDAKALFDQYTSAMDALEAAYPQVDFLYTTVPLTTDRGWKAQVKALLGRDDRMGPADNVVRERYNALVRERYAGTGRLFDIAAVQSTNPDGSRAGRDSDGSTYYVLSGDLASDAGHFNALGSKVAAAELVRIIAAAQQ